MYIGTNNFQTDADVTVVIMSFNNAKYICETIDSVLAQRNVNFELIVVDDCSTDESRVLLRDYSRIRKFSLKINEKNLGIVDNYNNCIDMGSGRYIVVLGSDDIIYQNHLRDLFSALELNKEACLAYSQCNWINADGEFIKYAAHPGHKSNSYFGGRDEFVDLLQFDNYITPSAVMLRRTILDRVRLADGSISKPDMLAGDWDLWIRIARVCPDFLFVRKPNVGYRVHESQVSTDFYRSTKPLTEHTTILEDHLRDQETFAKVRENRDAIWSLFENRILRHCSLIDLELQKRIDKIKDKLFPVDYLESENYATGEISRNPLVSVIVPTFNRPAMLRDAIESIANQTYKNWEIILVNDAGEDVSLTVEKSPCVGKITLINHAENKGLPASRNTALKVARGEIICYLDDDDLFYSHHLETVVNAFSDCSTDFLYVDAFYVMEQIVGENRVELGKAAHCTNLPQSYLLAKNFIPVNCWSHKRDCLKNVGYFDESLRTHEDWELLIRFSQYYRFQHIPKATVEVRQRAISDNMLKSIRWLDTYCLVYNRYPIEDKYLLNLRQQMLVNLNEHDRLISRNGVFPDEWSENEYLSKNPDVAVLVDEKKFDSGYSYYLTYGSTSLSHLTVDDHNKLINANESDVINYSLFMPAILRDKIKNNHPLFKKLLNLDLAQTIKIIVTSKAPGEKLDSTLASLRTQYIPTEYVVVCVDDDSLLKEVALHDYSWTLLINEGDILEDETILLLQHALVTKTVNSTQIVYFDHDEIDNNFQFVNPHHKPDFNYDLLLSYPYIGRVVLVRKTWLMRCLQSSEPLWHLPLAYRLSLQAAFEFGSFAFLRLPTVIAHLDCVEPAVFATTTELWQQLANILATHLAVAAPGAQIVEGPGPGTFHVVYPLVQTPQVSIVIPTRDQVALLSQCIVSIFQNTNYPNYEIIVVDNDSQTVEAREFLAGLDQVAGGRVRVIHVPGQFNFSKLNNFAVAQATGEFILMLNNDTAASNPDWLSHMVRNALRDNVGVVGARLLYPDGTLQHAGVIMGLRGPADHPCIGIPGEGPGYLYRAQVQQNFSAVTAACLLVRKSLYLAVGGLDETNFAVSYNDVDFCLRVGQAGKSIVWTPHATLMHEGSAIQRSSVEGVSEHNKAERFAKERAEMYARWPLQIANDPAFNPNLSLSKLGYELEEQNPLLRFDKFQGLVAHRVLALPSDEDGCGQYRVLQPMQAMLDGGLCTGGSLRQAFTPNLVLRSGADTLVVQRVDNDFGLDFLQSMRSLKSVKLIYEVDDHPSKVRLTNEAHKLLPKDMRGRVAKAIGLCDRLVVSTQPLARALAKYNGDIRVIPNRLPASMWGHAPPVRKFDPDEVGRRKPRVGWAGGIGHAGDLNMIEAIFKEFSKQVDWVFIGVVPESILKYIRKYQAGVPTLQYPNLLMAQNWDLAIAPLELHEFNECKSNLKLLEYGWCGIPVVCSDITPYQCGLNVTRVKNRFKDWRNAIAERIADLEACHRDGLVLQQQIATDWTLQGEHVLNWYKAWTD